MGNKDVYGKRLQQIGGISKREFSILLTVLEDYINSPFFCLTSESMLLSSATGTKKTQFVTK